MDKKNLDNQLSTIIKEQGVTNAENILSHFNLPLQEVGEVLQKYTDVVVNSDDDVDTMNKAKEMRQILVKARTTAKANHKSGKAESLATGRAFDKVYNFIVATLEPAETHLKLQADYLKLKAEKAQQELVNARLEQIKVATDNENIDTLAITKGFENVTDDVFGLMIDKIKSTVKTIRDERLKEQQELEEKEKQRLEQEKELDEKRKELDAQQARQKEINAELARKQKELDKANAEIATMQTQKSVVETLGMPLADMSSKETDIEKLIAYVEVLRNVKPPAITEPQFIQELAKMQATLLPWLDSILANLRQGR